MAHDGVMNTLFTVIKVKLYAEDLDDAKIEKLADELDAMDLEYQIRTLVQQRIGASGLKLRIEVSS